MAASAQLYCHINKMGNILYLVYKIDQNIDLQTVFHHRYRQVVWVDPWDQVELVYIPKINKVSEAEIKRPGK